YLLAAYTAAGAIAGVGGALLVGVQRYISPADVGFEVAALVLLAVIIGGASSIGGAFVGAALIVATRDWLAGPWPGHAPLLAGTLRPSRGQIRFDRRDITRTGPARRARLGIGRSFQTPALLDSLSTVDNLVLAAWRHTRASGWAPTRYRQLARRALADLDTLGLADQARQPAGTLPHGQRRLLDIAVALAGAPRLLLLDEPAAGLDDADLQRLQKVLRGLPATCAVVLVEHNLDLVTATAET